MDPSNVKGHFFLGQALFELNAYDESIKHLQRGKGSGGGEVRDTGGRRLGAGELYCPDIVVMVVIMMLLRGYAFPCFELVFRCSSSMVSLVFLPQFCVY